MPLVEEKRYYCFCFDISLQDLAYCSSARIASLLERLRNLALGKFAWTIANNHPQQGWQTLISLN